MRFLPVLFLLLSAPSIVAANISVVGNTISWSEDGWFEVQRADNFMDLCQGGSSCEVAPGLYNVINHSTGQRWESVRVGVSVSGNTISWPDDGWYQVQLTGEPDSSICNGTDFCVVGDGSYTVINHSTGARIENLIVPAPANQQNPADEAVVADSPVESSSDSASDSAEVVEDAGTATISELVEAAATIADPDSSLSILFSALETTGLTDSLNRVNERYTLFAPSDNAFNALGSERLDAFLTDPQALQDLVLRHLLLGPVFNSEDLNQLAGYQIETGSGQMIFTSDSNGTLRVNGVSVGVACLLYTSPSPRDQRGSRMPSSA